jgi:hypothetical protein
MFLLAVCQATLVEFSENLYYVVLNRFFSEIVNFSPPDEHEEPQEGELGEAGEVWEHPLVHFVDNLA